MHTRTHTRRLSPSPDTTIQKYLQRIQTKLQQAGAGPPPAGGQPLSAAASGNNSFLR